MVFDTEHQLLGDYQAVLKTFSSDVDAKVWMQAMVPLVERTVALLQKREAEGETFSARDLLGRFGSEDIEVFVDLTLAMIHPNVDSQGNEHEELLRDATMTTLHFPSNIDADAIQLEDNLSLLDLAAKFGIDPDLQVWEVNSDYL
jgi:hypothetical protein